MKLNKLFTFTLAALAMAACSNDDEPGIDKGGQKGIIWHTQGSGKSLSMVFFSGKLIIDPRMENPTLVILTDRNDLDEQLHETFTNCQQLLRQQPQKAESRQDLRDLLQVASVLQVRRQNAPWRFFRR